MADLVLSAHGVRVDFETPNGTINAVKGVDLDLHAGETIAIVGESGAGKSAFAKAILHLHQLPFTPNKTCVSGQIVLRFPFEANLVDADPKTMRQVRAQAIGMIFQDALSALNPVQTIGKQIAESILQVNPDQSSDAISEQVLDIVEAIGLPRPRQTVRSFPHQLSGGQCQRVMIAIAAVRHPVAIIADEPTTALDVTVQKQILKLLKSLQANRGMGMIFISHDLGVVEEIADHVIVMRKGQIVERGTCQSIFSAPKEAYTRQLFDSRPGTKIKFGEQTNGQIRTIKNAELSAIGETSESDDLVPIVSANNLSFSYRTGFFGKARSEFLLSDVSLSVLPGNVHGIVGESGSGKSTLGRLILGFIKPDQGLLKTCGLVPYAVNGHDRKKFRKAVQVVYQDSATALNPRLTLGKSAAEGLEIHGVPSEQAKTEVRRLFDQVQLPLALMNRFPHEVSGGQRQRVCIARALATKPKLLIADEPVTALDMTVQAKILELFRELQAELGLAMLFISHDLGVIREMCSHVTVMRQGQVVEAGFISKVFEQPKTEYTQTLVSSIPGSFRQAM